VHWTFDIYLTIGFFKGKGAGLKVLSIVVSVLMIFVFMSCASTPSSDRSSAFESKQEKERFEKRTPRFSQFVEALEYLGNRLNEEVYKLRQTDGFSTASAGDESTPLSPEEQTQQHAEDAMAELEREIAKQEGRADPSVAVTSKESYTTSESSNMGKAGGPPSKPMVIAIADLVNDDQSVSKLGRYIADKLTPYFSRSEQFSVLERAIIDKVIAEQQFQVSSFVDESSTQAFGKLLGAETIISGSVSELNDVFYINAKVVGVTYGNLLTSVDVEVDKDSRLTALYRAPLPKPQKEPSKPRIFRARGIGVPSSKHKNPTLARTLAARAAQADAMRNLVQEIEGAQIDSKTTVKDFVAESDQVNVQVNSFLRGARIIDKREMPDGAVEVEMEVEVPGEFFDRLAK
jgi:TolB-like protein